MEQKKTLWIIAAVGLFLLVVLGAAMFLYPPSARTAPAVATINPVDRKTDTLRIPSKEQNLPVSEGFEQLPSYENVERQNNVRTDENVTNSGNSLRVNDLFVVSENTTVYDVNKNENQATTIDLNALRNEVQPQTPVSNINITVNLPEQDVSANVGMPVVIEVPGGETKDNANNSSVNQGQGPKFDSKKDSKWDPKKDSKDSKGSKDTKDSKDSKTGDKTSSNKKTETTNVTATVSAKKTITRFWVQVAAYSNKKTAENARTVLDNNKIPADIFTYEDNKNRLFYRVRVGPYTTKSEAEYWKAKIEKISDFAKAESYITSTTE